MQGSPGRFPVSSILLEDADTYPIAGGIVVLEQSLCIITTETGASDDLNTITPGDKLTKTGYQAMIFIKAATGKTIVIKDASVAGSGNIECSTGADISLTGERTLCLIRMNAAAKWNDI